MDVTFRQATVDDALFIARGFQMAMLMEDVPEEQTRLFAEKICQREDVLYSWCNTLIAEAEGCPVGMVTAYDGRCYRGWRETTLQLVQEHLDVAFPGMEDEAVPGEYYVDSLAVLPEYRGQGIGRQLLQHAIAQGRELGLKVTLAVEYDNDRAQHLYRSLGFEPDGNLFIFGHDYQKMASPLPASPVRGGARIL